MRETISKPVEAFETGAEIVVASKALAFAGGGVLAGVGIVSVAAKAAYQAFRSGKTIDKIKSLFQSILESGSSTVHKNSLDYVGKTHVYRIRGADGTYKIGESAQGVRKSDGASIRAEQQVRALQRETGEIYESKILKTFDTKREAVEYQDALRDRLRRRFGADTLPGNREHLRGRRN